MSIPATSRSLTRQQQKSLRPPGGCSFRRKPGLTIMDMMHAIDEGKVRALYIMGENPVVSDPNTQPC